MKKKSLLYKLVMMLVVVCPISTIFAQGYKQDSLQIKAYTEIEFRNSRPQGIKLRKVFCDYCSKKQLRLLGEDAIRRTESEKYDPKNIIQNGKKKLAVYIRIAKTDFAAIKEDE
ncbi:hypothetical protein N7U66_03880 [Lacinutrix neustonica]|uniref:Uncharacterized protein n=1 Tax=Lacinutrix neustonica TaxID=2980107 RepID=A0A9E8MWC2_9FLAO|nr:hypothetical protein [Lacinutrix neustonica]WAC02803.1 hypothetical protein N7U66_03880 [Lacinutrix neustonica]